MILLNPEFSVPRLENILALEQSIHPLAEAVDYYKLVYQAYYGPSHMNGDIRVIQSYLLAELKSMDDHYQPMCQDIGDGQAYLRISLSWLEYGIDAESRASFLSGLIMKSMLESGIDREHWKRSWQSALPLVRNYCEISSSDLDAIQQLVSSEQIPHHSDAFGAHYNPHYRIIHLNYKQELQDYLEANDILEIK